MDTFEVYRSWFQRHYGREFTCTREQWDEWCRKGPPHQHARVIELLADQREIDRERQEGWDYDNIR